MSQQPISRRQREVEARLGAPIAELLERYYWKEQLTIEEMSAKLGVPPRTGHGWLHQFGLTKTQRAQQVVTQLEQGTANQENIGVKE